jgi:hypothetical protein
MSGLFGKPKSPKLPPPQAEPEPIATVTEDATEAGRRRRRAIASRGGRSSTILSGINSLLKKRLGE